jgi:hypothetical protein
MFWRRDPHRMNYRVEWMPLAAVLALVTLLFVPVLGFLIALVLVAVVALVAVTLVGAVFAAPFLIVRSLHGRWQARTAIADPGRTSARYISSESAGV